MAVTSRDPASPSEDLGSFSDQILRMVKALGLQTQHQVEKPKDPIFDVVLTVTATSVTIPYLPTLLQTV